MIQDAIVIGAGLSGLVCARRLVAAGVDAIVLEARSRVGGRLWSGQVGDAIVDLGGQWLSVDQPRLLALAAELGVESVAQPREGRVVLDEGGRVGGLFAQLGVAIAQWRAVRRISRMMRAIPLDAPASAADAAALDAIALGPWLVGTIRHAVARERIAMHAELVFATDPAGLSLLGYLARLGATGGFAPVGPELPGGGRDHRFVGGAQALALRLAEGLGERVRLGTPVERVERAEPVKRAEPVERTEPVERVERAERVERVERAEPVEWAERGALVVRGPDGDLEARHVVLAVPPRLAVRIAPGLPAALGRLGAAMQAGGVVKCFAAYRAAFWRDAGLSGEAYRPQGTVRAVVDATPPDGATPVLLAFVVGETAATWHRRDPEERRREVIDALGELFGEAARAPLDYLEADWAADPWSAGCVAGSPPGALTELGGAVWRGSHGGIHLAGTEAAVRWPGYMEGAIEAGERAADAVIAHGRGG